MALSTLVLFSHCLHLHLKVFGRPTRMRHSSGTTWTGTTRRWECRKKRRAPETQTTRPVRAHEWSSDHCLLATCQRPIYLSSFGSSLVRLHESRNYRRSHLYTMLPSRGKLLTPGQVEGLRALAEAYWQNRHPASLAPRPWEHDPVITRGGRARRARCMVRHAPTTLEAEYRLFRFCTLDLSARNL